MDFANYFPIWDKLTKDQQDRISSVIVLQKVKGGIRLHDGGPNCLGLLLVRSGQLRAYMLSEEGREITISRFFERDLCLFSASCVMINMQFDVFIETEKDSEVWVIPACLYQNLMDESLPLANYSHDLITNHLSEVMWLMEQIMWKSFDKRLAKIPAGGMRPGGHQLSENHPRKDRQPHGYRPGSRHPDAALLPE